MIYSIQIARAVAAFLVVVFHSVLQVTPLNPTEVVSRFGTFGVDLFFVISGFIMWVSYHRQKDTPGTFLLRRTERIGPLYWVCTLLAAGIALTAPSLLKSTVFDLDHLIASLLFIPWTNPAMHDLTPVVIPGWTLNYEMYFYLIFAAAMFCRPEWRIAVIAAALAVVVFVGQFVVADPPDALSFYSDSIVFEFVFGMLIAAAYVNGRLATVPQAFILLMGAAGVLALSSGIEGNRTVFQGLPAAAAIFAAVSLERSIASKNLTWLVLLGNASYSLYLTHVFTLALMRVVWRGLAGEPQEWSSALFILAGVLASLGVGVMTYLTFEKPLIALFRGRRFKRQPA